MLQAKAVNEEKKKQKTHRPPQKVSRIRHLFVALLTPALHRAKAANVIPVLSAPSAV